MTEQSRHAFVTGGGSGIGLAMARAFAGAGHSVTIAGRNEARLKASGLPYVVVDVCDQDALKQAIAGCAPIEVFCANAGGAVTAPALKTSRAQWDDMLALNLTSVFCSAQAAVPAMVERGWGRFIVTGSTASLKGYRYASAYAAAKHGVLGFVRSLAHDLAQTGVTANALCPGYAATDLITGAVDLISTRKGVSVAQAEKTFTDANPMGRLIAPAEIAAAALWLASEAAASINGQAIPIDGGETA